MMLRRKSSFLLLFRLAFAESEGYQSATLSGSQRGPAVVAVTAAESPRPPDRPSITPQCTWSAAAPRITGVQKTSEEVSTKPCMRGNSRLHGDLPLVDEKGVV